MSGLLEAPKTILNASPWVVGALDANHQEGHEGEEEGDNEAKPINCLIADHHSTVHLSFGSESVLWIPYTLSTCTDSPLRVSNPGRP